jgi:hypothetical protein
MARHPVCAAVPDHAACQNGANGIAEIRLISADGESPVTPIVQI